MNDYGGYLEFGKDKRKVYLNIFPNSKKEKDFVNKALPIIEMINKKLKYIDTNKELLKGALSITEPTQGGELSIVE